MIKGINCPLCGGEILERRKSFSCSNWKAEDGCCKFTIWKQNFGATFDEEDIIRMFHNESVEKTNISKAGNPYPALWSLDKTYGARFTYVSSDN